MRSDLHTANLKGAFTHLEEIFNTALWMCWKAAIGIYQTKKKYQAIRTHCFERVLVTHSGDNIFTVQCGNLKITAWYEFLDIVESKEWVLESKLI